MIVAVAASFGPPPSAKTLAAVLRKLDSLGAAEVRHIAKRGPQRIGAEVSAMRPLLFVVPVTISFRSEFGFDTRAEHKANKRMLNSADVLVALVGSSPTGEVQNAIAQAKAARIRVVEIKIKP